MRVLVQRVRSAGVTIDQKIHASIQKGLLILVGIHKEDELQQAKWLAQKCVGLRIFDDEAGKMNLSVDQVAGDILIISQFTLYGDCSEGRRPEFTQSARGLEAKEQYLNFVDEVKKIYPKVQTGVFAAYMQVQLINDGPVTLMIER